MVGELAPKTIAIQKAEATATRLALPLESEDFERLIIDSERGGTRDPEEAGMIEGVLLVSAISCSEAGSTPSSRTSLAPAPFSTAMSARS